MQNVFKILRHLMRQQEHRYQNTENLIDATEAISRNYFEVV